MNLDTVLNGCGLIGITVNTGTVEVIVQANDDYLVLRNELDDEGVVVDRAQITAFIRLCEQFIEDSQ